MAVNKPLVSIGMPVYNGERFIRQALDSLLEQDYENFELIISDNASMDRTEEICQEYLARDGRIRYCRNERNFGAAMNFNQVFKLSYGEYFMWAGDHDLWDKTFISRCVEILTNDSSVVLCYSQTMLIDLEGNELGITPDHLDTHSVVNALQRFHLTMWELSWCNIVYGLIRSSVLRKTRLFMPVIAADHLLIAELSLKGMFVQVPLLLFYRRQNYPDEDDDQALRRRLESLAPDMNVKTPYSLLMFHHLITVKDAPLGLQDKLKLIADVLSCFKKRFGVINELLRAIHLLHIYYYARKIGKILLSHLGLRKKPRLI